MSKSKRDRAKKLFSDLQKGGKPPLSDQEVKRRALAEKTARLKALRLARDASEAAAGGTPPQAQTKPKGT